MTIQELEQSLARTEAEIRALEGKLKNRLQASVAPLEAEATGLEQRLVRLRALIYASVSESLRGATEGEALQQSETLRLSACEHFKRTNTDIELWKSIAS